MLYICCVILLSQGDSSLSFSCLAHSAIKKPCPWKKCYLFFKTILIFMRYTIFVLTGSQKWMIFIFTINCLYFIEFIIIMVASHHSSGKFGCTQPWHILLDSYTISIRRFISPCLLDEPIPKKDPEGLYYKPQPSSTKHPDNLALKTPTTVNEKNMSMYKIYEE